MEMTVERLNYNREKSVLINMILSTEFCDKVLPVIKERYFDSSYAGTLIKWVRTYHEIYGVAPNTHINEMFVEYGPSLDPDIHAQVGTTLQHLSDVSDTEVHNIDYLIDVANDLFHEKHLEAQNAAIKEHLAKGDLISAENVLAEQYVGIDESTGHKFVRFDDEEFMQQCIREMVMQQDLDTAFFKFSGRLGEFIGPCSKGWFVAYLAPAKRGKTTYMLDAAIDSVRQKLNTVVISLEMPEEQLMQRYALAVTGCKPEAEEHTVMTPIMDCEHNLTGECTLDIRIGGGAVLTDSGILTYEQMPDWITCTVCRGGPSSGPQFTPSAWKVPVDKPYISEGGYRDKVKKFNKFFGKYGRIIHFPSKSKTVQDLRAKVKQLMDNENFIPDVIVIDYADLIKPLQSTGVKRHDLDDVWEDLRSWGQDEHILIISASQTNRVSAEAAYIKDVHVAEDYSKIAKLDIAIGLCQTDLMKTLGVMNINKVAHRHKEYIQSNVCTVLQEMTTQQSTLDSEFVTM